MRYRENLPLVLKGVNFKVKNNEKIGICGRTGSGKSTIILSILRILEAHHGNITIDGHDISQVSLKKLRQSITLIS